MKKEIYLRAIKYIAFWLLVSILGIIISISVLIGLALLTSLFQPATATYLVVNNISYLVVLKATVIMLLILGLVKLFKLFTAQGIFLILKNQIKPIALLTVAVIVFSIYGFISSITFFTTINIVHKLYLILWENPIHIPT